MTKTETLADVLRALADHVDWLDYSPAGDKIFFFDGAWWELDQIGEKTDAAIILAACMEECEANGWSWDITSYDPGEYAATIQDPKDEWRVIIQTDGFLDSPALALATALRDALEASQ